MVQVGSMYAQLGMEDASFKSGMANAQKSLNRLSYEARKNGREVAASMKGIEGSVASMTRSVQASAKAFIGAFAVGALSNFVKQSLDATGGLGELAQQAGITTDTLQELNFMATQLGLSSEEVQAAMAKLTRSIGEADAGAKAQADAFKVLGISTRDVNGQLKTTDEILPELIAAFSAIKDPAARAALQMDIFGRSGQKLDPLLAGGVEQINNLRNAAHELGAVISPDLIARADVAADKLAAVQQVLSAQIAGVVAENANAILGLADAIATAANSVGTFFSNMKGVERIQKYEGWSKGFFASWGEQKVASTEQGYGQRLLQQNLDLRDRVTKARNAWREDPTPARRMGVMRLVKQLQDQTAILNRYAGDLEAAKASAARVIAPRVDAGGGDPLAALRGTKGKGGGRSSGGRRAAPERDKFGDDLSALLERIKPDDLKAVEQYTADQLMLAKALTVGRLSAVEYDKALEQLSQRFIEGQFGRPGSPVPEITAEEAFGDFIKPTTFEDIATTAEKEWERIKLKNDELAESFMVMAQRINSDLRGLVDGIKSGDFFDIMDGVLGLFGSLSQTGLFGSGLQKTFSNAPAWSFGGFRADGGPVSAGKAYIVGERGPELFLPKMPGAVLPDLAQGYVNPRGQRAALAQPPVVVQLVMEESANLLPTVRAVSQDVSVQMIRSATPAIVQHASANTVAALNRPRL